MKTSGVQNHTWFFDYHKIFTWQTRISLPEQIFKNNFLAIILSDHISCWSLERNIPLWKKKSLLFEKKAHSLIVGRRNVLYLYLIFTLYLMFFKLSCFNDVDKDTMDSIVITVWLVGRVIEKNEPRRSWKYGIGL